MSAPHRMDVHQHVVPPFWAKALPAHGGDPSGARSLGPVLCQWRPESAIEFMERSRSEAAHERGDRAAACVAQSTAAASR
jgi:hypothetical protein